MVQDRFRWANFVKSHFGINYDSIQKYKPKLSNNDSNDSNRCRPDYFWQLFYQFRYCISLLSKKKSSKCSQNFISPWKKNSLKLFQETIIWIIATKSDTIVSIILLLKKLTQIKVIVMSKLQPYRITFKTFDHRDNLCILNTARKKITIYIRVFLSEHLLYSTL